MAFEIDTKIEEHLTKVISRREYSKDVSEKILAQIKSLIDKSRASESDAVNDLVIYVDEIKKILKEVSNG
jgi:hypothetical protein